MNRQDAKDAKKDTEQGLEPSKELDDLANRLIGAAIEVHRHLGPGYLENVYENALCVELGLRDLSFVRRQPISIAYKGQAVGDGRVDLVVNERLVVELKAVETLLPVHKAQVISYLKSTGLQLGLLINFNSSASRRYAASHLFVRVKSWRSWRLGGSRSYDSQISGDP